MEAKIETLETEIQNAFLLLQIIKPVIDYVIRLRGLTNEINQEPTQGPPSILEKKDTSVNTESTQDAKTDDELKDILD